MQINTYKLLIIAALSLAIFAGAEAAAPVAANDAYTVAEDTTLTIAAPGVLANDTDADNNTLTAAVVAATTHGTLTLSANGGFTFVPTANYAGADSFTYKANDGANDSNTATVTITITNVNDAPVIAQPSGIIYLTEGQAYTSTAATINVSDVDSGDTKTFSATPTIAWQNFAINAQTGIISFTPAAADIGAHLVDIKVTDTAGASDTKTFRFFVREACDSGTMSFTDVNIDDITDDDDELLPGDFVQAEFDLKNNIQEDLADVKVKAWIEDLGEGNRYSARVESPKEDIDSKDSKSLLMKLRLYLTAKRTNADLKLTNVLYIRAEGEDENGTTRCAVYQKDLDVERQTHQLLIENVDFNPSQPVCGGSATASALVYDIGRSNEDSVKLRARNSALKIDSSFSSFDLDSSGSSQKKTQTLNVNIPEDARAGEYPIEFIVTYNDGEDTTSITRNLNVTCESPTLTAAAGTIQVVAPQGTATVAVSQSTATTKREETVKFTVTLTNTEKQLVAYKLELTGIADWAEGSVEPEDITLSPGASVPVYVYLTPNNDAKDGEHTATVTVKSGAAIVDSKTLTTTVSAPVAIVTNFGNKAIVGSAAAKLNLSGANRDSALFVVLFVVVLVFAGLIYARDRNRKAGSRVEVIKE